ncbi:hypothetical protein ACXET9_04605 [Brachybacterium sp. DNPG3]
MIASLRVVISDWTGWSEEQPEPVTVDLEAEEGDVLDLGEAPFGVVLTVTRLTAERLTLTSNDPLSERSEGGGIDLRTKQTTFRVDRGRTIEMTTPTMDAGTTFAVTYLD